MNLIKHASKLLILLTLTISSCGDDCDEFCNATTEQLYAIKKDTETDAMVTFYGDPSRSNNVALQTTVRAG